MVGHLALCRGLQAWGCQLICWILVDSNGCSLWPSLQPGLKP